MQISGSSGQIVSSLAGTAGNRATVDRAQAESETQKTAGERAPDHLDLSAAANAGDRDGDGRQPYALPQPRPAAEGDDPATSTAPRRSEADDRGTRLDLDA